MTHKKHYIEVELQASRLFYTIVGSYDHIDDLLTDFANMNTDNIDHVMVHLYTPFAKIIDHLTNIYNQPVSLDDHIEEIQCDVISQWDDYCNHRDMYIILVVRNINNKMVLSFPEIPVQYNIDPSYYITNWLITNNIHITHDVIKSMQYTNIVGTDNDIVVYSALRGIIMNNRLVKRASQTQLNKMLADIYRGFQN